MNENTIKGLLEEIRNKTPIGEAYVESQKEFLVWLVKRAMQDNCKSKKP